MTKEDLKENKNRIFKEKISSVIGAIIMLIATAMLFANAFLDNYNFTFIQILPILILGWVFLMAKDSLIEGIFMNIFKIKKNDK